MCSPFPLTFLRTQACPSIETGLPCWQELSGDRLPNDTVLAQLGKIELESIPAPHVKGVMLTTIMKIYAQTPQKSSFYHSQ